MSDAPLIVLPPIAISPEDFDPVELGRIDPRPADLRIRRYPGHAGEPRRENVSFRLIADELAEEIGATSSGYADIVGIGMGAYVLTELLLHHASRVRSAVVISTPLGPVSDESRDLDRANARSAAGGMASIAEATIGRWFTPWAIASDDPGVIRARARLAALSPDVWSDYWSAIAERTALDDEAARRVAQPITIVAPVHDPSPNVTRLKQLSDVLPVSRLMYVDGSHMVMLERPENVLAAIDSHLSWAAASPRPVAPLYWVGK